MSKKPNPVALTACMLHARLWEVSTGGGPVNQSLINTCASLSSKLHHIAKGATRASIAECNGELWDGQRAIYDRCPDCQARDRSYADLDAQVAKYSTRIDRAITKLNADLAALSIVAKRNGDPRGIVLRLYSTDPTKPLPSNCAEAGVWGVL